MSEQIRALLAQNPEDAEPAGDTRPPAHARIPWIEEIRLRAAQARPQTAAEGEALSDVMRLLSALDAVVAATAPAEAGIAEYRDVWPSGSVISEWQCREGQESGYDYQQFGPGMEPQPPWERQRRTPGGEWTTVFHVCADGSTETKQPDGTLVISRTWWE